MNIVYDVSEQTDTSNVRKLKRIFKHFNEWHRKHDAQFEVFKYILMHFTKNSNRETKAVIFIEDTLTKIKLSREIKYLKVIFNQKLTFSSHLQYVIKKGIAAVMTLSDIVKNDWNAKHNDIQQLFLTAIAIRTDYATCIWHHSSSQWCQFWLDQTRIFEYSMSNRGFVKSFVFIDLQTQICDSSSNIRTFDVEIET